MILLVVLACARPTPAPLAEVPAIAPAAIQSRLNGWSILMDDGQGAVWTELWGPVAAEIAAGAAERGAKPQRDPGGPPTDLDPETARRFFSAFGAPPRPAAWTWPDNRTADERMEVYHPVEQPMRRFAVEVFGVGPARNERGELGLRVWFRHLDGPRGMGVTDWTTDDEAPRGAAMRSFRAAPVTCADLGLEPVAWSDPNRAPCATCRQVCSELPIGDDRLVATEHPWRDDLDRVSGSCAAIALKRPAGGTTWFAPSCRDEDPVAAQQRLAHLADGMYSLATGPSLPTAWFGRGEDRLLVVNQARLPSTQVCLAPIPEPDRPLDLAACVGGRTDLGGF